MGGRDRGGKYAIELMLLKCRFLEELVEPPPAKPPAMVPTALNWASTTFTDPVAAFESC